MHATNTSIYHFFFISSLFLVLIYYLLGIIIIGYEVPFVSRIEEVNKLYDEKVLNGIEVMSEIDRLLRRDSTRLHGNDPFAMK